MDTPHGTYASSMRSRPCLEWRWPITVKESEIDRAIEFALTASVVILFTACLIGIIFGSFIGSLNSFYFLAAALLTLGLSFFFGDVVKLRFYVENGRYHIHHALYGIILLGVDVLIFNRNLIVLGIVWGLLLSEAKFFVTERRQKRRGHSS